MVRDVVEGFAGSTADRQRLPTMQFADGLEQRTKGGSEGPPAVFCPVDVTA